MLSNLIDGLLLSDARAGEGYLLPFWTVLFALCPLTVLIHELGHGVVGMAVTGRPVKIHVRLGSGWCTLTGGSLTARQYAAFVAAGPLASLVQTLSELWLAASAEPGSTTQWCSSPVPSRARWPSRHSSPWSTAEGPTGRGWSR